MNIFVKDNEALATDVQVSPKEIRVVFSDGSEAASPLTLFPRLLNATPDQRNNWRWIGSHHGMHWPDVDEDIAVHTIVREDAKLSDPIHQVPFLIADLLRTTGHLGRLFSPRPFTPDGHLVGSIGEVVARYIYDLELEDCSTPQIDARTKDNKTVQIKLTGRNGESYGIRWSNLVEPNAPDLLICLKLTLSGFTEVYAGRFPTEMLSNRSQSSNGQLKISVTKLIHANCHEIVQVHPLDQFNKHFHEELAAVA